MRNATPYDTDDHTTATRDAARREAAGRAYARAAAHAAHVRAMSEADHRAVAEAAGLVPDGRGYTSRCRRWTFRLVHTVEGRYAWLVWDTTGRAGRGYAHTSDEVSSALRYAVQMTAAERATTVRTPAA